LNQKWRIVYLDEKDDEPTKGLDEGSGFYRNRPFWIVSRLPKRRVLEAQGGRNIVIKTRKNNYAPQLFYFDHLTRTVKSW
jgi:hypothetical protein